MKDFIGNEITVSAMIAYPGRSHSSVWINVSKVLKINEDVRPKYTWQSWYDSLTIETKSGRKSTIHRIDNVVVIKN